MISLIDLFRSPIKIMILTFACVGMFTVATPAVFAQNNIQNVIDGANNAAGGTNTNPEGNVNNALRTGINILSWVVGVAAVVGIILSGLKFVTSSGDPQSIAMARRGIIYSAVGVVVVILAQGFVNLVVSNVG